MTADSYFNL